MADATKIEWTDATWNIVNGCSVLSPGCKHCYAMQLAGTRLRHHPSRKGLTVDTKAGPVWTGEVRLHEPWLDQPLKWTKPRDIFVCAHGDLFHEAVTDEMLDKVFAVIAICAARGIGHRFQILTKRSARMRIYLSAMDDRGEAFGVALAAVGRVVGLTREEGLRVIDAMTWPLPNVWAGVSVEDQQRADERVPDLLATPAVVRWISAEPLLGPVDLTHLDVPVVDDSWKADAGCNALSGYNPQTFGFDDIARAAAVDWVVVGGESGRNARPMHPDWARALRDQCAAAGVSFLFKQWGAWSPLIKSQPAQAGEPGMIAWPDGRIGCDLAVPSGTCGERMFVSTKGIAGRLLDGVQHDGVPA